MTEPAPSPRAVPAGRTGPVWWGVSAAVLAGSALIGAFHGPESNLRIAYSDGIPCLLIGLITWGHLRYALRSGGYRRIYWGLMAVGSLMWALVQFQWFWVEAVRQAQVPEFFWGDIVLFLHVAPMISAIAVQPHLRRDRGLGHQRVLDILVIALWWLFLYGFVLLPWQFVHADYERYSYGYNFLYMMEHIALMIGFAVVMRTATGRWRRYYRAAFFAALAYGVASLLLNLGVDQPPDSPYTYSPGSLYDLPWLAALLLWTWSVLRCGADVQEEEPEYESAPMPSGHVPWASILAATAAISMPLLAASAVLFPSPFPEVDRFRLLVTGFVLVPMTGLVFLRNFLLNRAMGESLARSRMAYRDLERLQSELLQTEKLASIGRLVAGAAHEINNPLTAILGYSDLLAADETLDPQGRDFSTKIKQQVRRTKALVDDLLAFAKQSPIQRQPLDLERATERALALFRAARPGLSLNIETRLQRDLPAIEGDEARLVEVFLHILNNAADAMEGQTAPAQVLISTGAAAGGVYWRCADSGPGVPHVDRIFDPFFTTKPPGRGTGLGLSVSYGTIREHGGEIVCVNRPEGGAEFTITLPAASA
jgi:signal transduction histidine kinase